MISHVICVSNTEFITDQPELRGKKRAKANEVEMMCLMFGRVYNPTFFGISGCFWSELFCLPQITHRFRAVLIRRIRLMREPTLHRSQKA